MEGQRFDLHQLSDRQVLDQLMKLHLTSAEVMADLLCHLAEVERRQLHLREATRSLFAYAVEVLHCTEDQAWRRVTAAQTAARFPLIFDLVARGDLTITSVNTLRHVLTQENHAEVLAQARHKTKAQLDEVVARLAPKPDVPARLARMAERAAKVATVDAPLLMPAVLPTVLPPAAPAVGSSVAPSALTSAVVAAATRKPERDVAAPARPDPARLAPLSPERWKLSLTIGAEAERALRKARDLTPGGDLARIVERAVIEYAEKLEARKYAKLKGRQRPSDSQVTSGATGPALDTSSGPGPVVTPTPGVTPSSSTAPTSAAVAPPATSAAVAPPPTSSPVAPPPTSAPVAPSAASRAAAAPTSALARASDTAPSPTPAPRPTAHRPHIPRAVVRAVVERDGERCAYVSPDTGRRCSETSNLHIHHVVPYARGGQARLGDLELRCATHDAYQAVLDFGAEHIAMAIARRRQGGRKFAEVSRRR